MPKKAVRAQKCTICKKRGHNKLTCPDLSKAVTSGAAPGALSIPASGMAAGMGGEMGGGMPLSDDPVTQAQMRDEVAHLRSLEQGAYFSADQTGASPTAFGGGTRNFMTSVETLDVPVQTGLTADGVGPPVLSPARTGGFHTVEAPTDDLPMGHDFQLDEPVGPTQGDGVMRPEDVGGGMQGPLDPQFAQTEDVVASQMGGGSMGRKKNRSRHRTKRRKGGRIRSTKKKAKKKTKSRKKRSSRKRKI